MSHEDEYHDKLITLLEVIWGEGYMAPGGFGNVAKILKGTEPKSKRILDIGSGLGGPAFEMATTHGATVVGVDLETGLIDRANKRAEEKGLADQCMFRQVEIGPYDFPDESFDIVVSSGALTQTEDKEAIFRECYRILKPDGWISLYDWTKSDVPLSDDMRYWFKMEGLTFSLETLEKYKERLENCGFLDVVTEDATDWYQAEAHREIKLMKGELYDQTVELIGQEETDLRIENWRAMIVVIDSGEMRQCYCKGQKPG
ncbi:MAG: methyltransferase domain-containing protein [Woeseiaceae bacterium]|nr:methyltransferase domain-containing protein [Woeseiaceae bacterium]